MKEWAQIPFYEKGYMVTRDGHFKSPYREIPIRKHGNYILVTVKKDGVSTTKHLHVLVALTFIPNPENKPYVNHMDRNRVNNCVSNLEWVTHRENQVHWNQLRKKEIQSFEVGKQVRVRATNEKGIVIQNAGRYIHIMKEADSACEGFIFSELELT